MIAALSQAVAQLAEPRLRRPLYKALAAAAALFVLLHTGLWWLLAETALFSGWAERAVDLLGGLAALVLSLILFPGVVSLTLGLFLEDAAAAVEARHYPDLPPARAQPVLEVVAVTLRFAAAALVLNALALPLYLVPGGNLVVFYGLNGYLLGREYYELVALRRLDVRAARGLRQAHRGRVWLAGVAITFLLALPLVNLAAPVVAVAFMLHLFEALRRRPAAI